jgi:prophage maintenance system killer protein
VIVITCYNNAAKTNEIEIKVEQEDLVKFALAIATKKITIEEVSLWLKEHIK